jgi:hypothetical protein
MRTTPGDETAKELENQVLSKMELGWWSAGGCIARRFVLLKS